MPVYDRRLESQDQPSPEKTKLIDHSHLYYGPDHFAIEQAFRDQPHPGTGFWSRIRSVLRRRPRT